MVDSDQEKVLLFIYLIKCRSVHLCEGASYNFLKPYKSVLFLRVSTAIGIAYFSIGSPEIFLATENARGLFMKLRSRQRC